MRPISAPSKDLVLNIREDGTVVMDQKELQANELLAALERKFKCKLKPTVEVDSSLIGGVRVTVGDEVLDTSVRARLARMQTALTA